jgi:hypothetical protein
MSIRCNGSCLRHEEVPFGHVLVETSLCLRSGNVGTGCLKAVEDGGGWDGRVDNATISKSSVRSIYAAPDKHSYTKTYWLS